MNILFLDDSENRCKTFRASCPSATIVNTAADCVSMLSTQDWNYVFLDHDLGGREFVGPSKEETGYEVAQWIAEHKPKIGRIIIHSFNVSAAILMEIVLKKAGYKVKRRPFDYKIAGEIA
jgi:CheY-like chemotaxis protein